MPQQEIEIVLSRNFAEQLTTAIFIVNPAGDLVYYNEPAEKLLGTSYEETGTMSSSEWGTKFHPVDQNGESIPPQELPLLIAITQRQPAHNTFWIVDLDGNLREIEVTALPLIGRSGRLAGGMAIFWERSRE
jgi:PAS domain-containing protein